MLFTDHSFLLFFLPLVLFLHELAGPLRLKLGIIFAASLVFYSVWNPWLLSLLAGSITVNFLLGRALAKRPVRALLVLGIAINLLPLCYFKYSGLISGTFSLGYAYGFFGERLGALLPLGISFFTFQQIAFLVDVWRGKISEDSFLRYGFFISFFPQLIAGPIVRYQDIMPQLAQKPNRRRLFYEGLVYFVIGFSKKMFLADTFADYANPVFTNPAGAGTEEALIATLAYTFQIYFDFSGYSDMALGLGRMFGWKLPVNFESPYKAVNIVDFWRRWHITLSRFLRNFVYIPLGGNRRGEARRYWYIMLTMLIGGLWHGASLTFVLWGGLHGLGIVVTHAWHGKGLRLPKWLGWGLTFALTSLLWVLFRTESVVDALFIYTGYFKFAPFERYEFWALAAFAALVCAGPSSNSIVTRLSDRYLVARRGNMRAAVLRFGGYIFVCWALLYGVMAGFYQGDFDRRFYARHPVHDDPKGVSYDFGDFRNNIWSKDIFARTERKIVIAGASFTRFPSRYEFEHGGQKWVTESLGIGGNGILNGARVAYAVAHEKAADTVILAVSPLNFGRTTLDVPFPGECLPRGIVGLDPLLAPRPFSDCFARDFTLRDYMALPFFVPGEGAFQFREFMHNVTVGLRGAYDVLPFAALDFAPEGVGRDLAGLRDMFVADADAPGGALDTVNGRNDTFGWAGRGVVGSLREGGLARAILREVKAAADANDVRLIVYETPTVTHDAAPYIYPEGFYPRYRAQIRRTMADLGIEYLDLGALLPWRADYMHDFVHVRYAKLFQIHRILLYSAFYPELVRGVFPEIFDTAPQPARKEKE